MDFVSRFLSLLCLPGSAHCSVLPLAHEHITSWSCSLVQNNLVSWLFQQFAVKCLMCTFKALSLSSSVFSSWLWSEFPSPKHSSGDPSWRVRWYCRQAGHLCLERAAAGLWRGLPAWLLWAGAALWQLSPRPASEWGCWWEAVWWFPARDETSALLLLLTNHWREVFQHS